MLVSLALILRLVAAGGGECYFVGNSRLLELPSCDVSPATIDELTEEGAPARASNLQRARPGARLPAFQAQRSSIVVRGNEELEQRLEDAEQRRVDAVAQRVVAEDRQREAERQRDALSRRLAAAKKEVAELRARVERLERDGCAQGGRPAVQGESPHAR